MDKSTQMPNRPSSDLMRLAEEATIGTVTSYVDGLKALFLAHCGTSLLLATVYGALTYKDYLRGIEADKHMTQTTKGIVTSISQVAPSPHAIVDRYEATVQYEDASGASYKSASVLLSTDEAFHAVGDEIEIRYDSSSPEKQCMISEDYDALCSAWGVMVISVLGLGAVALGCLGFVGMRKTLGIVKGGIARRL